MTQEVNHSTTTVEASNEQKSNIQEKASAENESVVDDLDDILDSMIDEFIDTEIGETNTTKHGHPSSKGTSAPTNTPPSTYTTALDHGISLVNECKFSDTIRVFTDAKRQHPEVTNHSQLFMHRALCYKAVGNSKLAFKDINAAVAIHPVSPLLYMRGALLAEMDNLKDALVDLNDAIRMHDPGVDPGAHYYSTRATVYTRLDRDDLALLDLNMAIKLDIEKIEPEAFCARATLHRRRGNYDLALHDINRLVDMEGSAVRVKSLHIRGTIYMCLASAAEQQHPVSPPRPYTAASVFEISNTTSDWMRRWSLSSRLLWRAPSMGSWRTDRTGAKLPSSWPTAHSMILSERRKSHSTATAMTGLGTLGKIKEALASLDEAIKFAQHDQETADINIFRAALLKAQDAPLTVRAMKEINDRARHVGIDSRGFGQRSVDRLACHAIIRTGKCTSGTDAHFTHGAAMSRANLLALAVTGLWVEEAIADLERIVRVEPENPDVLNELRVAKAVKAGPETAKPTIGGGDLGYSEDEWIEAVATRMRAHIYKHLDANHAYYYITEMSSYIEDLFPQAIVKVSKKAIAKEIIDRVERDPRVKKNFDPKAKLIFKLTPNQFERRTTRDATTAPYGALAGTQPTHLTATRTTEQRAAKPSQVLIDAVEKGKRLIVDGKILDAIALFSKTLGQYPQGSDLYDLYFHRAQCYRNIGPPELAVEDLTAALKLRRDASLLSMRGDLRTYVGLYDDAEADLSAAIELEQNDVDRAEHFYFRGNLFAHTHDSVRAVADYSASIQLNPQPTDADIYFQRSHHYFMLGQYASAMPDLDLVVAMQGHLVKFTPLLTRDTLGMLLALEEETKERESPPRVRSASAVFSLSSAANDPMYGLLAHGPYRSKAAIALAQRALEDFNRAFVHEFGYCFFGLGKFANAMVALKQAHSLGDETTDTTGINLLRAMVAKYQDAPTTTRAMQEMNLALESTPDACTYLKRVELHVENADVQNAVADLNATIEAKGMLNKRVARMARL
ncbi:Aste57867_15578 [Aphanomyces stellatus]|uniref:Aste57867_15578 protein n=1 Tax=Aphanomyces stellatus TaxID=120398 RepID=A0A485L4E8_9STRA|nr:hypothetical protein As57867_015522 [Aphanomyces stellatus]VFT92380.1 Aste57867_15578 [Aphanomyces stellatus]